jgi:hypothetical protein
MATQTKWAIRINEAAGGAAGGLEVRYTLSVDTGAHACNLEGTVQDLQAMQERLGQFLSQFDTIGSGKRPT